MNIKTEQTGSNQMGLIIEINATDYNPLVEKGIKDFRQKASVPGFRPGMVPVGMVKKMHGPAIKADEVNKIVVDELHKYLTDNKISYLGEPILNHEKSTVDFEKENADFSFYFEIGIQPKIDLTGVKLDIITEYEVEPAEEDLKKEMDYLTRQYGTLSEPETVGDDDLVYGNITRASEPEVEPFESTIFLQAIEGKKIKKDFIGKKATDVLAFDLKKAFGDKPNEIAKALKIKVEEVETADTNITFQITRISRITPSEINEELFAKVFQGEDVKTEEEFMSKIKLQMGAQYAETTRQKFMNDAIAELIKKVDIDVPHDFMKKWLLESNHEATAEMLEAEYDKALDSIKWQLIENKLVEENNIQITRQDIKEFIMDFFRTNYFKNSTDADLEERLSTLAESSMKTEKDVKNIYDQLFDKRIEEAIKKVVPVAKQSIMADKFVEMINKK
jgi:trigger factor